MIPVLWSKFSALLTTCVPDVPADGRAAVPEAVVCGPRVKGSPSTAQGSSPESQFLRTQCENRLSGSFI